MKKTITILCTCILFSIAAQSQITKGNWMVGGDASFSADHTHYRSNELSSSHRWTFNMYPDAGYFLIDKLALGLRAGVGLNHNRNGGETQTTKSLDLGPFARYYFLPVDNIINIFAGAAYEHHFRMSHDTPANIYSVFVGPSFFFNSSVAAELLSGFGYDKSQEGSTTRTFKINIAK
jgi:hypothetical protein